MSIDFAGRVVLVTGASGIAAAGARHLAALGASVFVVSRTGSKCRALADEIAAAGGICDWAEADLTDEEATSRAVERCVDRFGRVDGLFAVAGGSGRSLGDGPLHDMGIDGWVGTLEMNGLPAFLAARDTIRVMLEQPVDEAGSRGSVLLVGSVLAEHPAPGYFATHAYAAVKGAEVALTKALAAYYAPHGIRVNLIASGLVRTPMAVRAAGDPAIVAYAQKKQPLAGGLLEAEDLTGAAAFFLGEGSRRITGQILAVDGGWSVSESAP